MILKLLLGGGKVSSKTRTPLRISKKSLAANAKSLAVGSAEYLAYSYVVNTGVNLWNDKAGENGEIPDGYETIIEIVAPILLGSAGRRGLSRLTGREKKLSSNKSLVLTPVQSHLISMPIVKGLGNNLTKQTNVRNFSYFRSKSDGSINVCNSLGQHIYTLTKKGLTVARRAKVAILGVGGAAALDQLIIDGGTKLAQDRLFNSETMNNLDERYLGLIGQAIESMGGINDDSVPGIDQIKCGGRWYDDIGDLHYEIFTNTRSVKNDISFDLKVDEDSADDILSKYITDSESLLAELSVRAFDLVGESILGSEDEEYDKAVAIIEQDPEGIDDGSDESVFDSITNFFFGEEDVKKTDSVDNMSSDNFFDNASFDAKKVFGTR
jgi:hypothetical protein